MDAVRRIRYLNGRRPGAWLLTAILSGALQDLRKLAAKGVLASCRLPLNDEEWNRSLIRRNLETHS